MADVNKYLQIEFQKRNISFHLYANNNALKSKINTTTDIIFKDGTVGTILGFNMGIIKGDGYPNITESRIDYKIIKSPQNIIYLHVIVK